jgi:hypothetical protein
MTLQITHASIVDVKVIHANASRAYLRQIRAADEGWVVSYTPTDHQADPGPWPQEADSPQGPLGMFRPTLLQFPTLDLSKSGAFKGAEDLVTFAARLAHDAQAAIRTPPPAGTRTPKLIDEAVYAAQVEFTPAVIGNEVSETYGLETAMWIDATLRQGVGYELTVPLSLPGVPHVIVEDRLQFVFTREVPCSSALAVPSCVELVVRATPLEQPLQEVLTGIQLPRRSALHYASSIVMRLIVDPQTLKPYLRDTHRYWYVTVGKRLPDSVMMESDHSELNFAYK